VIKLNVEQGTPEWFEARKDIPTASCYSRIVTATGKKSAQQEEYLKELTSVKEKRSFQSNWMTRGISLEVEARQFYELKNDVKVEQVGLVFKDSEKLIACSPDGLLPDRGLEIKCPSDRVHSQYLIKSTLPTVYIPQVQGSMFVTGLDRWDFLSYHPDFAPLLITVERDDEYQKLFTKVMNGFLNVLVERRRQMSL
jgi:putative phage-type endonuclease